MRRLPANGIPGYDIEEKDLCWFIPILVFGRNSNKNGMGKANHHPHRVF
jgi:hypothetical protein